MSESDRPEYPGDAPEPNEAPPSPGPAPAGPSFSWTPQPGPSTPPPTGPAAAPTWSATNEPPQPPPYQSDVTQPTEPFAAWPPPPTSPPGPAAASSWPPPPPPSWPPSPPGGYGAGGWGQPTPPAGGWSPPPDRSPSQRVVAAIVAVLLVIASAGVGAAIALAVHHDTSSSTSFPSFGGNNNGGGGFFGGGSNNGTGNGNDNTTTRSCSDETFSSSDAKAIADRVDPAVVNINTTLNQGRAAGTGMVISPDGAVLTNNHVIADSTNVKVDIGGTGNVHTAHVVGYDVQDDVALLQIEGVSNLKTVNLGDPAKTKVGDCVVAIGNALGKGGKPAVAQGQVTALNRRVTAGDPAGGTTETLTGMIQIDAPIQPGDSGGPLVDTNGNVIGVNTAAASGRFNVNGSNVGFAIPVSNAMTIIRQIQSGTETDRVHIGGRALLGVSVQDIANAGANTPVDTGAYVSNVQDGSGASDAGIQSGDVITSINGKTINDQNELHLALTIYHPGDKVDVGWVDSNGDHHTANVQLGSGPPA